MRCFACNMNVPPECYDKKSDRYYCGECFEATNQIILTTFEDEISQLFKSNPDAYNTDWFEATEESYSIEYEVDYESPVS